GRDVAAGVRPVAVLEIQDESAAGAGEEQQESRRSPGGDEEDPRAVGVGPLLFLLPLGGAGRAGVVARGSRVRLRPHFELCPALGTNDGSPRLGGNNLPA